MADLNNIRELALKLNLYNIGKGKIELKNKNISNLDFLESILAKEIELRRENRIKNEKKKSNIPTIKFKMNKCSEALKSEIETIKTLKFIKDNKNILIIGKCSTGKTSLASEIGNIAIDNGYKVSYFKQDDYIDIIQKFQKNKVEIAEYKNLKSANVIIIDDFLYLNIKNEELELLYKSLMYFNETCSLILITNRDINKISDVASDKHLVTTLVDRLKSNAYMLFLS